MAIREFMLYGPSLCNCGTGNKNKKENIDVKYECSNCSKDEMDCVHVGLENASLRQIL